MLTRVTSSRTNQNRRCALWQRLIGVISAAGCLCLGAIAPAPAQPAAAADKEKEIPAVNAEMNDAIAKVKAIVNQPVGALKRTPGMNPSVSSPGWFHDGAIKPDFNNVDVRLTQETSHFNKPYVTSDLNPGYVFVGSHLEFNPMIKYFYTDRSVPKKKLTEAEMLEINRLYRIIGACEKKLRRLQPPEEEVEGETAESEPARKYEPVPKGNYVKAAIGVSLVLILYFAYRKFR